MAFKAKAGLLNIFKKSHNSTYNKNAPEFAYQAYLEGPSRAIWSSREYGQFAEEAYTRNVIAFRSISMIAEAAASIALKLIDKGSVKRKIIENHPVLNLLKKPNPCFAASEFFESIYSYRLISGNSYVLAINPGSKEPKELFCLRPDRVKVIPGKNGVPQSYRYQVGEKYTDYPVDRISGFSKVLHFKTFHPLNDWYGLSPVEAAAYSIDQHNNSGAWNQALLQNSARPSGALIVKVDGGYNGSLSEDQFTRLKGQIDEQFSGAINAGRPILLEGGLDWKEMSLSPKDMDFLNAKHSSARDIALSFGVPPQLLGIPGDNTYSNYSEARLSFWEETVIPLAESFVSALNSWLVPQFANNLELALDLDKVTALNPRRNELWNRVKDASFLSDEEKRKLVGI